MGGMFNNLSSGLAGQLADNVLGPGLNRITGDNRAGEIGANIFKDKMPGMFWGGQQSPPGYQMPTPSQPQPQQPQQQDNKQYYQQMRQSIEGLNEALKQIEGIQTPGGQYQSGDTQMMSPGGKF
jgi:hypothetical protein